MPPHGRKYGEKDSHPIPIWNGIFEHFGRVRTALWEFAWCIDKITEERDGIGIVLGGMPVKLGAIVEDLKGSSRETVRLHLKALEKEGYIRRKKTPYGYRIEVLNSLKFRAWKRLEEKPENLASLPHEKPKDQVPEAKFLGARNQKTMVDKEDATKTQQRRNSGMALPGSLLWERIGVSRESMPPPFAKLCQGLYATKGDQSVFDFMGVCMDAWEAQGNRIPRAFAKAKAALRNTPAPQEPFPVAETEEWGAAANYRTGVR